MSRAARQARSWSTTPLKAPCAVAFGRRNFAFLGADTGGERVELIYTLIGAKLNNLDPEDYLRCPAARARC